MKKKIKLTKIKSNESCEHYLRVINKAKDKICLNCHHFLIIDGSSFCGLKEELKETKFI